MNKYEVISGRLPNYEEGSIVTDLQLLEAGVNVISLLAAGHIKPSTTNPAKQSKLKEEEDKDSKGSN
jgi:hypothetical protein